MDLGSVQNIRADFNLGRLSTPAYLGIDCCFSLSGVANELRNKMIHDREKHTLEGRLETIAGPKFYAGVEW